mgnify:CR=1 FL=1
MRTPSLSRSARLLVAASLIVAMASCGGDSSSSNRNRNAAIEECLPGDSVAASETTAPAADDPCASTDSTAYDNASETLTCESSWDAGSMTVNACADVEEMHVDLLDNTGSKVTEHLTADNTVTINPPGNVTSLRVKFLTKGSAREEGKYDGTLEFDLNTSAVKSFTYKRPKAQPADKELHFSHNEASVTQTVTLESPLKGSETVTGEIVVRQSPEDNGYGMFHGNLSLLKNGGVIDSVDVYLDSSTEFQTYTLNLKGSNSSHEGVDAVRLLLRGRDGRNWAGNYGPQVTSAKVMVDSTQVLKNPDFNDGPDNWVTEHGFQVCSGDEGGRACVTDSEGTVDPSPDTTLVSDTTIASDTTVPVDTTVASESTVASDSTANTESESSTPPTISVQEVPCSANFAIETKTVTLCESFDRIVAAAFDADGKYSDTISGSGTSIEIPENLVKDGGVRFLRIATGQAIGGKEVVTFRGEGIIDLGDAEGDVDGTIYVSPKDQEALNSQGPESEFWMQLDSDGTLNIDTNQDDFAFFVLGGRMYSEYEHAKVPESWKSSDPLAWSAYSTDGFGLPRLIASGTIVPSDEDSTITYNNPKFELNAQKIEVLTGYDRGESADEEVQGPCGAVTPYLITTPVTPSNTNMVTFTVATDCESTDSLLGLVVYGNDGWLPVFSQFKSTRFSSRMVVNMFLADGQYDVSWGDYDLSGYHAYVVNGGGSGVSCLHPHVDVDTEAQTATLSNCNPGGHRMRLTAYDLWWQDWQNRTDLRLDGNTIDLSNVPWKGWFNLSIDISNSPDPDLLVCVSECDPKAAGIGTTSLSAESTTIGADGGVTFTHSCSVVAGPEGEEWHDNGQWNETDYLLEIGTNAFEFYSWMPHDSEDFQKPITNTKFFPSTGKIMVTQYCSHSWFNDNGDWQTDISAGLYPFEITGTMPNRPSNDNFADAPAIEPGVGRVKYSNVSATNEVGEAGTWFTNSTSEGQFHSVWFTYTPTKSGKVTFGLEDPQSDVSMRAIRRDGAGQVAMMGEGWISPVDLWFCGCPDWQQDVLSFYATAGTTYYLQVMDGDIENGVGPGTILVNGGDGSTVEVPLGDTKFSTQEELDRNSPDTTVAKPVDTTVPSPDTTVPGQSAPQSDAYHAALQAGSTNETAPVLAPSGDSPATIEVRSDTRNLTISVSDLMGTVRASSASVDTSKPMLIRQRNGRPIIVRPGDRTVTVPVGSKTTDLSVTGLTADGKQVTAPLTVKKTLKPLVSITGSSDSGSSTTLYAGIGALVLVLLGGGYVALNRKKKDGATQA